MSQKIGDSAEDERTTLPIEKGFPIERVNEIAQKEDRAGQWYRPIYTMHKWWARRLGCVFRAIALYTLLDEPESVSVYEPGKNESLKDFGAGHDEIEEILEDVNLSEPESLWELYPKDVRVGNKRVLDPFMGGGTSIVESSRFDVETVGSDVNPVAWFISKKELEAHKVSLEELEKGYEQVEQNVSEKIKSYYTTPCPNGAHNADVMYYFWVKELDCVSCGSTVSLFNDYRVGKGRFENDDKYNVFCPSCESVTLVDDWQTESVCKNCSYSFTPAQGNIDSGYVCQDCGQKYGILEGIQEQDGFSRRLYAVEYYCPTCEKEDCKKSEVKGYKSAELPDRDLFDEASKDWKQSDTLKSYIPNEEIPEGIKTDSTLFEGSIGGGHNVIRHGYTHWKDMFNDRQLLCLASILEEISNVQNKDVKEYLLLAFTETLNYSNMMSIYQHSNNKGINIFKSNSFDPPHRPIENNIWGTEYGAGNFQAMWDMVKRGVKYAKNPTERYVEAGDTLETEPFEKAIGENSSVYCSDMRELDSDEQFDAVITDPPYYHNVIYSELSDYFYVWQRILLKDEYEAFEPEKTPRKDSIVANPAVQKGEEEFEDEIRQSFNKISDLLVEDGVLAFTYHHSDAESWGELLSALCDVGFEVTATYPISADTHKFFEGEAVSFDIIIVARPSRDRKPISWNSLRRDIYRTAQKTRQRLEENRDLSRGDIGVVEMGRCFHEYSKHHGKVKRAGETMTAKEVVDEIYGVIQHGSDIGEIDVFLDLLETADPSFDDLNKLCRGTDATPEEMEDMRLYRMDDGFTLGTYDDEKRIAYIQDRIEDGEELTDLDKAQFLRYRWEHGKSVSDYLDEWGVDDDLRELCEGLADATGDDTYRNILETRLDDF